jgi:hypothetical protein
MQAQIAVTWKLMMIRLERVKVKELNARAPCKFSLFHEWQAGSMHAWGASVPGHFQQLLPRDAGGLQRMNADIDHLDLQCSTYLVCQII